MLKISLTKEKINALGGLSLIGRLLTQFGKLGDFSKNRTTFALIVSATLTFLFLRMASLLYDKEVLQKDLPPPDLDDLRTLLIDEKAVRRGHNYVTIVLNGDTGELLYMAEGKKREVIDQFFAQLTVEQKNRVEAVGIDRSGAYQSSVEEHLPEAAIVYDRFHLMLNLNQAVDEV